MKQNREFFWMFAISLFVAVGAGISTRSWALTALSVLQALIWSGIALGSVPVRVFCWHFIACAIIEFTMFQGLSLANIDRPIAPAPIFPMTFLYLRIWPYIVLDNQGVVIDFNMKNMLRSLAAGMVTSGVLGGLLGLLFWYRFGGEKFGQRIAAPFRAAAQAVRSGWTAQPAARQRTIRAGSWIFYGFVIAVMTAGGWWKWFGPVVSLAAAGGLFAFIVLIAWVDWRQRKSS